MSFCSLLDASEAYFSFLRSRFNDPENVTFVGVHVRRTDYRKMVGELIDERFVIKAMGQAVREAGLDVNSELCTVDPVSS